MDEHLDREDILKVWRDYFLTEDACVVVEKTVKVMEPQTSFQACWKKKLCPEVVHDFTGFTTESIKEIMKELVAMVKKGSLCVKVFKICILDKFKK